MGYFLSDLYEGIAATSSGELIRFGSVQRWVNGLPKAFFRRNGKVRYSVYLPELGRFLGWLGEVHGGAWDPDMLLERRMEDLRSDDILQRRWVEEQVQRYYKTALSERLASMGPRKGEPIGESTKQGALTAVASFFKANYVPLTKLNVRRKAARVTRDYWFTMDDVRGMCEVGSALERAYILVMLSLGLRRGDVLWLTWMDVWPYVADAGEGEVVGPLDLFTEKHGVVARSFLSPDSVQALRRLRAYQEERGRLGKYVFRKADDTAFDEDHMNRRLKILFKRAGRVSRGLTVRSHGLRKMLYNEMKNEGAPVDVRNMIVGKTVSEDIAAYVNDDELKKWFIKALPRVSLGEPRPRSAAELKKRIVELEDARLRQADTLEWVLDQVVDLRVAIKHPERAQELLDAKHGVEREKLEALGLVFDEDGFIVGRRREQEP